LEQYRLGGLYKREKFLKKLLKDPAGAKIGEKLAQLHVMEAKMTAARNDSIRKKDEEIETIQNAEKDNLVRSGMSG